MHSLKKGEGVPLSNFKGGPEILLLNFEGGSGPTFTPCLYFLIQTGYGYHWKG